MYEITYQDSDCLQDYIEAGKAYRGAVYDYTFEDRFFIYHFFVKDTARYVALDSRTGYGSEVTRRNRNRLFDRRSYRSMTPLVLESIKYTGNRRYLNAIVNNPLDTIETIFRVVLPEYGFALREEQINLSKDMYLGLTGKQVAICEAEVGTGKTMAYLVAAFVAKEKYAYDYGFRLPVTISTSSIELQRMIVGKEIPQLSRMLQDFGLIKHPLVASTRKGKEHYFCKARYDDFHEKLMENKEKYENLLDLFEKTKISTRGFDLDVWDMPAAIKNKICVKGRCGCCAYKDECRYANYIKAANGKDSVDYQVTNHNLFLASVMAEYSDPACCLIRSSPYVVIDEAHKLLEAAQSTFGAQFTEGTIQKYINSVQYLKSRTTPEESYKNLLETAKKTNQQLFAVLRQLVSADNFDDQRTRSITLPDSTVTLILRLMETISWIESARKRSRQPYAMDGQRIVDALKQFVRQSDSNIWLELDDDNTLTLCCCLRNMAEAMAKAVWNRDASYVLTSGTMSDGADFEYFKRENGISRLPDYLVSEHSTASPFDYTHHTRLYIPKDMPVPDNSDPQYLDAITDRILQLVEATNGHTAILFTSYKVLQAVYDRAIDKLGKYEVFCMTRSNRVAIRDFRNSKNGVLFASGSMWEGVDCVGDCLSSVIIVRLPFPMRSAAMEQKKKATGDVYKFVQEYAVPIMLIKLRQGVGRLIRCETDTGVISILDSRAATGSYVPRLRTALSKYPTVDSVEEVREFMKVIKNSDYFA